MDKKDEQQSSDEEINFESPNFNKLKTELANKNLKAELTNVINDESVKKLEDDINLTKLNEQLKHLESKIKNESNKLPKNWERYEDDKGAYFWHIPRYYLFVIIY